MWHNPLNVALRQEYMEDNALEMLKIAREYGVSLQALAGILGNFQAESTINPGMFEGGMTPYEWRTLYENNYARWCEIANTTEWRYQGGGMGQWTPWTKLAPIWQDATDGETQTRHLFEHPGQWNSGNPLGWSFDDYLTGTGSPEFMAEMFCRFWEVPGNIPATLPFRQEKARFWYRFLLQHALDGFLFPTKNIHRYNRHTKRRLNNYG